MKRIFLIAAMLFASCAPGVRAQQPNIVIVTLDTTRADRMGFLGSKKGLTPHLDALANEATVFTHAYAHAPLTTVSHASLLTGSYPLYHTVDGFGVPLPRSVPSLPDLLRQRGYRTGAFVGAMILDPINGMAPGFDRGFDTYDAGYRMRAKGEGRYETFERRAADVVARAMQWLSAAANGKPFFLWVHVFDPHEPYDPPAPFRQKFANPYDGEIAYADRAVGQLFAALKARDLWSSSFIAVMADHGESFGEHNERTHGVFLYDSTIHVPLVMKFPKGRFAGKRAQGRVGVVDVAPTALEIAGAAVPRQMSGQSLVAMLTRNPDREAPSYSETKYPANAFGWSALAALRTEKYLYVRSPRREIYDLTGDPDSKNNLALSNRPLADRIAQQLENLEKFYRANAPPKAETELDQRLAEKLAALGYVAAGGGNKNLTGADPKDKIEVANQLHAAQLLHEDHEYEKTIPILQQILSTDPQIFSAQMMLGAAYFETGKALDSVPHLRKATELQPESGQAHYSLGRSLMVTGDAQGAANHFEITVNRLPRWPLAHFLLGSTYAAMRQPGKAIAELRTAAELDPNHYGAHLMLGRILAVEGQPSEGLPYLQRATLLRPVSREAFRFLGDCYQQLGRTQEAADARAKAASLPAKRPGG